MPQNEIVKDSEQKNTSPTLFKEIVTGVELENEGGEGLGFPIWRVSIRALVDR